MGAGFFNPPGSEGYLIVGKGPTLAELDPQGQSSINFAPSALGLVFTRIKVSRMGSEKHP
jgi:hypothetical protein